MAELPLLLFPKPGRAPRTKRPSFMPPLRRPSHDKQEKLLSPKFERIQNEFKGELQQTAAGAEPTKVLVMETVGGVQNFVRAVERTKDLEWMGELVDNIIADEDFYDEKNKGKEISAQFYLIMTNQKGVDNLMSLWNLWKRFHKEKDIKFPKGVTLFRDVFNCLHDIRYWGVEDRIKETGLLEGWLEDLKDDGESFVRVEAELWFRRSEEERKKSQKEVEDLIKNNDGEVIRRCVIAEIGYHGVLARIPRRLVKKLIKNPNVGLLECENVMFYSPVGQAITDEREVVEERELLTHEPPDVSLSLKSPVVGILDGMPIRNHEQLKDRLHFEDPDRYADSYADNSSVEERKHGTSMASLIIHGDLEDDEKSPLSHRLYMRLIMKPLEMGGERVPEDEMPVDLIHRAVVRMFKGEGGKEPVAPDVKIINLSIGLPSRPFLRMMSPLARLLDWLSCEYNVLFVISAGNCKKEIKIDKSWEHFKVLLDGEKEAAFIESIYKEERHRRILSPAESINGIAVGALHDDSTNVASVSSSYMMELFKSRLPSPISTFGSGHRRAIKPDLVYKGGRVCYQRGPSSENFPLFFKPNKNSFPLGIKSAWPGLPGELDKCAYSYGTSNATALVSRLGAKCHDVLLEVFNERVPNAGVPENITPLIKAMIVHGCSWGEAGDRLKSILRTNSNGRQIKNMIGRWLGYGVPDDERVLACTDKRVTLLGVGQLKDDEAHLFNLPLPPSLSEQRGLRRLIVTLAWLSPIKPNVNAYRAAKLWFEVPRESFRVGRQNAEWNAVKRGTVQHEVFEGAQDIPITDGDNLTIKVNCQKDAAEIVQPVSYGLAVTLEVAEKIDISIYKEIASRIPVPMRGSVKIRKKPPSHEF